MKRRFKHSLSNGMILTCDMGELIPINWFEALPGDSIRQATACLVRLQPMLAPVMHACMVRIHHWFVPNRLIWEDWEEFITGGPDGTSTPDWPKRNIGTIGEGSLLDYIGVPPATYTPDTIRVSALPLRAYNLIFNNHYRDQDLVTELTVQTASGTDTSTNSIQRVSWPKDYFTTARPFETKGDEITIPILGDAPITGFGAGNQTYGSTSGAAYETDGSGTVTYANYKNMLTDLNMRVEEDPDNAGYPNIRANLSAATGVSINDLRLAHALQRYQEARAKYGSRMVEYLRSLGIRSSDARLQNPEYLGGGRQTISISEVLQTAEGTDPVGDQKGHGIAAVRSNRYIRFFEEHGIVMSLLSVIPRPVYSNALRRGLLRQTKEDYWQKELQHIGDQEVLNKELYSEHSDPDGIFGFQSRYDEYRTNQSSIAGEFRSTLDHWHLARIFTGDPALNSTFVECTPTKRVMAAPSANSLRIMVSNSVQARRLVAPRA